MFRIRFNGVTCLAAVLALAAAGSASATPAAPAPAATAPAATNKPADPAPDFHKATPAEIQAELRAEPLVQAAFFSEQFDHDPTDAQIGLYLSNALRALGRNAEAADTAHRVLLFAPDNVDVLIAAARAHIADNNAFFAIDPLQHVIQLKPNNWQAYSLLGVAYDQTKRGAEAQTAWTTALKLSPDNPAVLTNIAMSRVTKGDFAGAEPLLRTAVAQKGATLQERQNLALVLGLEGKMDEAEKLLRQDLPPDTADANLAWLQQSLQSHAAGASAPTDRTWATVKSGG